jgi:hypothetical protein
MNIWLGVVTLIFILVTTIIIYIRRKSIRNVIWNIVVSIVVGTSLYIGHGATQVWAILVCSIIIGACLLISVIHAFNKLLIADKVYESIGENRKPRSFGNGYWR